eukprot:5918732-Amphidinium_carterae.1
MLPHEAIEALLAAGNAAILTSSAGLDPVAVSLLEAFKQQCGSTDPCLGLSLWLDAVPYSWDGEESLQCITWGLPGI